AELREVVRQLGGLGRGGDDVEVSKGLLAPPDAPRLGNLERGRMLTQDLDDGLHSGQPGAEQWPNLLGGLPLAGELLDDPLLELRADSGENAQALGLRRRLQVGERGDAELLPDLSRRLRAEARQAGELDDVRRHQRLVLRQRTDLALVDDLDDLALDRLADAGQLLGLALEGELSDEARLLAYEGGGPPVGEQAVGGLAFELQDVGEQLELLRDVGVARESLGHGSDHRRGRQRGFTQA